MSSRRLLSVLAVPMLLASCSDSGSSGADTTGAPATTTTEALGGDTSFRVQPGVQQIAVLGLAPDTEVKALAPDGAVAVTLNADEQGAALFRELLPADGWRIEAEGETSTPITVASPTDVPPQSLYTDQPLLPAGVESR